MNKDPNKEKSELHPRSKHRQRYDFNLLTLACPELKGFVKINEYQLETIDFFDPLAVKMLNKALLKVHYSINYWDIPDQFLCPPIPGRADYIHHAADLLEGDLTEGNSTNQKINCLDVGVGANCIYPILGIKEYGWSFVGSDIDPKSLASAKKIVDLNPYLKGKVELRIQPNKKNIFTGIVKKGERFDLTICNPPFHSSLAEAQAGTLRKLGNLTHKKATESVLNFGGKGHELRFEGGEPQFLKIMISQSALFKTSCRWFTCLVSKKSTLEHAYSELKKVGIADVKAIPMGQGNKISRILAWTFLSLDERAQWSQ